METVKGRWTWSSADKIKCRMASRLMFVNVPSIVFLCDSACISVCLL